MSAMVRWAIGWVMIGGVIVHGSNQYDDNESIRVDVDVIGSFHNPAETYEYYSAPVCQPEVIDVDDQNTLGDSLSGTRRHNSVFDIKFKKSEFNKIGCQKTLSNDEVLRFIDIIKNDYMYNLFVDDLPVQGIFGRKEEITIQTGSETHNVTNFYLFLHVQFDLAYNQDSVIACNITSDPDQRLELRSTDDNLPVSFTYAVDWKHTDTIASSRLSLHSRHLWNDKAMTIHWLSIANSFVLMLLLTSFLSIIMMRVLRNDFQRYSVNEGGDNFEDSSDESGWKQVHGDVFRYPDNLMMFTAMLGTGAQLLLVFGVMLFLAMADTFHPGSRGVLYSSAVANYVLTSPIAGYISGRMYAQLGGLQWATNAVATSLTFFCPLISMFVILNSLAMLYGSTAAVPATTILAMIATFSLIIVPLTVAGAMQGKANAGKFDVPCKTNRVRREIPSPAWHQSDAAHFFIAGFLPFSAIYIELHYIFAAVWGHQVYRLFGILSLAFVMLLLVTAVITVSLTYFQLSNENYMWWWRSFFNGGASGLFMFAYSALFFFFRSTMHGMLQMSFFFGYMSILSYAFSLMLGSVGFATSLPFVKHMYSSIKSD